MLASPVSLEPTKRGVLQHFFGRPGEIRSDRGSERAANVYARRLQIQSTDMRWTRNGAGRTWRCHGEDGACRLPPWRGRLSRPAPDASGVALAWRGGVRLANATRAFCTRRRLLYVVSAAPFAQPAISRRRLVSSLPGWRLWCLHARMLRACAGSRPAAGDILFRRQPVSGFGGYSPPGLLCGIIETCGRCGGDAERPCCAYRTPGAGGTQAARHGMRQRRLLVWAVCYASLPWTADAGFAPCGGDGLPWNSTADYLWFPSPGIKDLDRLPAAPVRPSLRWKVR